MAEMPTRRAMLAGMAVVPALAVTACPAPAPAASPTLEAVIARYERALRVFNAAPCIEDDPLEREFNDALDALDAYEPQTPHEFVRAFSVRFSDELLPTEGQIAELAAQATRLAGIVI